MNPNPLVPLNHFTTPSAITKNTQFSRTCFGLRRPKVVLGKRRMVDVYPIAAEQTNKEAGGSQAPLTRRRSERDGGDWRSHRPGSRTSVQGARPLRRARCRREKGDAMASTT